MRKDIIALFILGLLAGCLIVLKPMLGFQVRMFLAPPPITAGESNLAAQNEKLKAELAELQNIKSQLPQRHEKGIQAIVYSRYPFNFHNELLVNAGTDHGVTKGNAVTFDGMLIGKVSEVFSETSLVQTIFDEKLQFAARIGSTGIQALFKGGGLPTLSLISPTAAVKSGDIVYSAAENFPLGLPIAEIKDIKTSSDMVFQEAILAIPYDIGRVSTVLVIQ